MVGCEDHDCVVQDAFFPQCIEHSAHAVVYDFDHATVLGHVFA